MKKEKDLFNNIIGYDDIKKTLTRLIDVLNNKEKYEKIGSTIPHGLFISGEPGTGKTSFSNSILKNVKNRKTFIIRKIKSDGSFLDYIEHQFEKAIKEQPSIILLDDLDKFSKNEEGSKNQEEYVAIQAQIDKVKNEDVFVIATVNEEDMLPKSLLRSGRFDIKIIIKDPNEKDSLKIIKHYLKKKKVSKKVNIENISQILVGSSCADLEKVCNQAGLYAGFSNKEEIEMDELVRAALELRYNTNLGDINEEDKYSLETAYHEAGHTLIGYLLEPGSISFATISKNDGNTAGFTINRDNEYYFSDINYMKNRIKMLLGGKAATEIIYNKCDVGTKSDLRRAFDIATRLIENFCLKGYDSYTTFDSSNETLEKRDLAVRKIISDYYSEVRTIIRENKDLLDELAKRLNEKKILFASEIDSIISSKKVCAK